MNKLILALLISISSLSVYAVEPAPVKKICIDKVDKGKPVLDKAGKPVQVCKDVKQHTKLEGTKVEDVKKK